MMESSPLLGASGGGRRLGNWPAAFSMNELLMLMSEPAIQNLAFLRQLIAEARAEAPSVDAERLRMIYGTGTGTDRPEDV